MVLAGLGIFCSTTLSYSNNGHHLVSDDDDAPADEDDRNRLHRRPQLLLLLLRTDQHFSSVSPLLYLRAMDELLGDTRILNSDHSLLNRDEMMKMMMSRRRKSEDVERKVSNNKRVCPEKVHLCNGATRDGKESSSG